MVPVPTAAPYHHGNLRAELLEAAVTAIDENGVDSLSLRALARQAGVSHAAPARHFPDRQALLDAVAIHGFEQLKTAIDAAGAKGSNFDQRFTNVASAYIKFAISHSSLLDLMYRSKHREGAEEILAAGERTFEAPLALIAEAQAAGEIIEGDPEFLASVAFSSIHGLASLAGSGMIDQNLAVAVIPLTVQQLGDGLRPR